MSDEITYKVSVYDKVEVYKGKKRNTYYIRWRLDNREWKEPFHHSGQADSFRSSLNSAAKRGEAFSTTTGRPVSWGRAEPEEPKPPKLTWYTLTLGYTKLKWKYASPNQRRSIAESLTDATEVLLVGDPPYELVEIRRALRTWAFSARLRGESDPSEDLAPVLKWLEESTIPVADLANTENGRARAVLERISSKQDGTLAAPNTANRKRAVLSNIMSYAIHEKKILAADPLKSLTWTRPRKLEVVDPRRVANMNQARRFLDAVGNVEPNGKRLKAFFGCMIYAAMRPEEVTDLRDTNLTDWPDDDGAWGEFLLTSSQPRSGSTWTDDGTVRQRAPLKHRAEEDTRPVPAHPALVKLIRDHMKEFGIGPGGRIFNLAGGGIITDRVYLAVFHDARTAAFTDTEAASLLVSRPYDWRHMAVSLWLNAGVAPAQVAEWAGHSTDVLLRVYAKCISGEQDEAKRRILEATEPRQTRRIRRQTRNPGHRGTLDREP